MQTAADFNYFDMMASAKKSYSKLLEPICREKELTRNELDVLLFLYNNPRYDRAADIVSRRGIAKSHVSLSVSTLEEKGLLVRRFDARDRRAAHLTLTPSGQEIAAEARCLQQNYFSSLYEGITREEFELWRRITQKVCDNIQALSAAAESFGD